MPSQCPPLLLHCLAIHKLFTAESPPSATRLYSAAVRALDPPPQPEPAPAAPAASEEEQEQAEGEGTKKKKKKGGGSTPPALQVEGLGQIEAVALSADGALAAAVYRHKVRSAAQRVVRPNAQRKWCVASTYDPPAPP